MSLEKFPGRELPGGEIEIIGRAVPKKSIKVPVGEVRSYLPKAQREQEATFEIGGDPAWLAWFDSLDDDLDAEEIDFSDNDD